MGCGSSREAYVRDRRAYHGVAMAPAVSFVATGSCDVVHSAASHNVSPWETHTGADKKADGDFSLGVNEALHRRMRRERIMEWCDATLGVMRAKQRVPAHKPRYDHLTQFRGCHLGMVDELSTCMHVAEMAVSDGATRSEDRSLPSSLSTSGCTTFVNHASIDLDASMLKFVSHGSGMASLNASSGPPGSRARTSRSSTNPSFSVNSNSSPSSHKMHSLQRYRLDVCNNGHTHRVKLVLLVPPGDILLSSSTVDRHMVAYHLHLKEEVGHLIGHDDVILGGAVSPDGRLVATASRDCTAILWELPSCKQRRSLPHPSAVHACRFSSSGTQVATVCADGLCRVWTWSDTDVVQTLMSLATGIDGALTSLAYTLGDRHLVVSGAASKVFVWDLHRAGEAGTVFRQHHSIVISVDASRTLQDIVVSADERNVYLWNSQTLAVLHCINVDPLCLPRQCPPRKLKAKDAAADVEPTRAASLRSFYWTTVQLVDSCFGVFVVAAASDKCAHFFGIRDAAQTQNGDKAASLSAHVSEVLSLPFSSSLSSVGGGPWNSIVLGDACGNRHILTLM
ncbi:hypothetical protein ABB37_04967 [Leptomonas pyrrhocoris]|uniref:Uncharacterized protein n=1 Tax=Leptomonas pyrrhocoris TaxID=157538 RepID=A0A0M9G0T0_LEPPY|nr:hypothetical protein ABB37_04967 [Leptomonas pyrrhocoris]KPA79903.1 hypothetical protein ABB37_04967 [Leptomonas pyrrhocoris]|eukprot:XP_015658342.1 hypothetical protein ABB37_04967 [Leptomonas pyrrhocoris]